jgi:hypothetical protein
MDTRTQQSPGIPLTLLGAGWVGPAGLSWDLAPASAEAEFDAAPLLKDRKTIKLMAKQDRMALVAAASALKQAGLNGAELHDRTGVYAAIGALAFDEEQLQMLAGLCIHDGQVDVYRNAAHVYQSMNPLTTFKCLPNMAVFHISFNLGIHGPYFITYPGVGQWESALLRAWHDLNDGLVDFALVGSVAEQNNMLVRYHFDRLYGSDRPVAIDCAAFWVLARDAAGTGAKARIADTAVSYSARGLEERRLPAASGRRPFLCGPSEISLQLCLAMQSGARGAFEYRHESWDGASSLLRGDFCR